jgi:radical SAM superfamily enzyme YgiQ (UPF0313 family)
MNNALYTRPDTGEPMATIQTSRGCSSGCIYCLSPTLSGKHIRYRSPENVLAELTECYEEYGIRNFFFRADTFTMDQAWVKKLCESILASPLAGKIAFTANSRTKPLARETLQLMKEAGCWMVAFGFESGSDQTLQRMRKGTTIDDNIRAARWAREVGLPAYGFYLIGMPWETHDDLALTEKHIFDLDTDFLEIHVALPYYGTKLYESCRTAKTLVAQPLGTDYFNSAITGTQTLTIEELEAWRARILRRYHLRSRYLLRRLRDCIRNPRILSNYLCYGLRMLRNTTTRR